MTEIVKCNCLLMPLGKILPLLFFAIMPLGQILPLLFFAIERSHIACISWVVMFEQSMI